MLRRAREGIAILAAMLVLLGGGAAVSADGRDAHHAGAHRRRARGRTQPGGQGGTGSRCRRRPSGPSSTTGTSTGAVNSLHDSYTAIGGLVPLVMMLLGEVAPGGVGAGMYGILLFAIVTVFIAGLMVGRTPELLGKRIGAREVQLAPARRARDARRLPDHRGASRRCSTRAWPDRSTPGRTASARSSTASPRRGTTTARPSPGLTAGTDFYDGLLGVAMVIGRFAMHRAGPRGSPARWPSSAPGRSIRRRCPRARRSSSACSSA